jgi:pimeloyl-ACP methyl ester carboxylesterase
LKLYLISGLGADERAFKNLIFAAGTEPVFIRWIEPAADESLQHYCTRLKEQINQEEPFNLLGMSFGGITALELSKIVKPRQLILLSSIVSYREMPWTLRLAGMLKLHRLVPKKLLTQIHPLTYWFFGAAEKEERELLREIIVHSNPVFVQWAINVFLHWKGDFTGKKVIRIHGTDDRLLPLRGHADYRIKGGGHFMVYAKALEVSSMIASAIADERAS